MLQEYEQAIADGNIAYIRTLSVKYPTKLNEPLISGILPLNKALQLEQIEVVKVLIKLGCRFNKEDSFRYDERQKHPIHYASAAGFIDVIQVCI